MVSTFVSFLNASDQSVWLTHTALALRKELLFGVNLLNPGKMIRQEAGSKGFRNLLYSFWDRNQILFQIILDA